VGTVNDVVCSCVGESDGITIIFFPLAFDFLAGQDRKRCNCMCSGNARMWDQLCSPGESNSDHQVLRSPSDAPDSTVSSFIRLLSQVLGPRIPF